MLYDSIKETCLPSWLKSAVIWLCLLYTTPACTLIGDHFIVLAMLIHTPLKFDQSELNLINEYGVVVNIT